MKILGGLSTAQFFEEYWQQKPLLIRSVLPNFKSPLTPEELAGLACEPDIQARLIKEHPQWQVQYSPFTESDFTSLPESGYSLLVMDIEKHLEEFDTLRRQFRFIPDWCFDDIMMSYAPKGSSVGAHIDQYDVFLLQSSGTRRWQVESTVRENPAWIKDSPLRILETFNPDCDWILKPGDMLYLPPGMAHHGIANSENCTTISIGYRAFSHNEIVTSLLDQALAQQPERYMSQQAISYNQHPAQINNQSVAQFREILEATLTMDDATLKHFIGNHLTEPNTALPDFENPNFSEQEVVSLLEKNEYFEKNLTSKFSYTETKDGLLFHADGQSLMCSLPMKTLIEYLCDSAQYQSTVLLSFNQAETMPILQSLLNRGCIV